MGGGGTGCSGDSEWGEVVLGALETVMGGGGTGCSGDSEWGEVVLGALETVSGGRWCRVLWRQ